MRSTGKAGSRKLKVLIAYESGYNEKGWKSGRTTELVEAFEKSEIAFAYFGIRSKKQFAKISMENGVVRLIFISNYAAKLVTFILPFSLIKRNHRAFRSPISTLAFLVLSRGFDPDICVVQSTLSCFIAWQRARGRYVITECAMTFPRAHAELVSDAYQRKGVPRRFRSELPRRLNSFNDCYAFARANEVLVFSNWSKSQFPAHLSSKVRVVSPISIEIPESTTSPDFYTFSSPIKFIFVGQVGFRKGFDHLLEAWSSIKPWISENIQLEVYGDVLPSISWYLDKHRDRLNSKNIYFRGNCDWRRLLSLGDTRHVLVMPSIVEGSPRVVYEATALGIPAIVTPASCPGYVEDGITGLVVNPGDENDLARAMSEFLENDNLWLSIVQKLVDVTPSAFGISYGDKVVKLCREVETDQTKSGTS